MVSVSRGSKFDVDIYLEEEMKDIRYIFSKLGRPSLTFCTFMSSSCEKQPNSSVETRKQQFKSSQVKLKKKAKNISRRWMLR